MFSEVIALQFTASLLPTQPAITCSKLIEALEQGVKYVQSLRSRCQKYGIVRVFEFKAV